MPRPKQGQSNPNLNEAIRQTAWTQIAQSGAPTLSLRAIARELNITAPAIYNYFPSLHELVTALIVEAFTSFAAAQQAAIDPLSAEDHRGQLWALGKAYRDWAVTYPERYQLIFGTPIPGYHAPMEQTGPAAMCSLRILINVLDHARQAGQLRCQFTLGAALAAQLEDMKSLHPVEDARVLYLALVIWARVHGLVSMEIGHQHPPMLTHPLELYNQELEMILDETITRP
jgi:AcrR family transcriptional regulator